MQRQSSPVERWTSFRGSGHNEERLHSELNDQTPAEVKADYGHQSQPNAA